MLATIFAPMLMLQPCESGQTRAMPNLDPVSFERVVIADKFWSPRLATLRKKTLPHQFEMLEKHHYERNFNLAISGATEGFHGFVFHDSDVYKVLEAASLSLATVREPDVEAEIDKWIEVIGRAQMSDGYVNTHFQIGKIDQRWKNLRDQHELYCAGHLIEAAVAHFRATGKRSLLDIGIRFADLIDSRFGAGKTDGYPGHPELELALIKLYDVTGEKKYFDLARHFIVQRGTTFFAAEHNTPLDRYEGSYWQDRVPIKEWDVIEGHAVRATYLLSAIVDVVRKEFDADLEAMLQRVWRSAALRRTYVTGGIGSSGSNEGFTTDYDLPNATAYQETCASIAMAMWNHRMGLLYGDAKYLDVVETALYNAALSGISLDGEHFFYANPLESRGQHRRPEWYSCACCPPNIARTLAQIGGYAYASSADGLWVNLYIAGQAQCNVGDVPVNLKCETEYPWEGEVKLTLELQSPASFALRLRIPSWGAGYRYSVNGNPISKVSEANGYLVLEREWSSGDIVTLSLPLEVRQVEAHPLVTDNVGKLAIARGPIIYCLEGVDHEKHLSRISIPANPTFETGWSSELGGFVEVRTIGFASPQLDWGGGLYRTADIPDRIDIRAVPYHLWANRDQSEMQVWIPTSPPSPIVGGPELRAQVAVSFHSDWANPIGVNDGKTPKKSADHPGELCHFWPNKGGTEWVQYSWKTPISAVGARVYWFDDTGRGECRPPDSWRLEYLEEGEWKSIPANYSVALDEWCEVKFAEINTSAIRLIVNQQESWSVGIHEWQIVSPEED